MKGRKYVALGLCAAMTASLLAGCGAPSDPPVSGGEEQQQEELFVLTDHAGDILAVGALFHEDERWPVRDSAYYLHHLASRVDAKGAGSLFLQMAEEYTARMGKRYLRLDSAVGNRKLEQFYAGRGYVAAGTCKDGLYEGILRQKELIP